MTAADLQRLVDGYLSTQLLVVAAELGIADALAAGPRTAADLAEQVGARAEPLRRILRGLAADGVLDEGPDATFGLTETGRLLCRDDPQSLRGAVLARGRLYYRALGGLLDAVREGGSAFARAHGTTFFDHLDRNPDDGRAFQSSMASRARLEAAAVVAAFGFDGHHRIVDVGGGRGVLLAAILAAHPGTHGVLLDRPDAARLAADTLAAAVPAGTWEVVGGDFFDEVPTGGDLYVLSRVLHDWDDAAATAILRTCRRAAEPGTALAVVEAVLPERAADGPAAIRMDLHMLALFDGGRERTAAEYAELLDAAGFALVEVVPTGSPSGIGVLSARAV